MNPNLHYSRSPLTEAVIDVRVALPDTITLETLAQIQAGQEDNYPTRKNAISVQGQLSFDPDVPPATGSRTHMGYRFVSQDERQVIQARRDGFTFSRLAPYESWESFRAEGQRWWLRYREFTQPKTIQRVAVRYINRLDLPLPLNDFKDYLRTVPEVSPDMSQELDGYFMQLRLPQPDLKAMLLLNEALIPPPPAPPTVSVLLDIDLFREVEPPQTEAELWNFFELLRQRKNQIFEACITEVMRELIR
ncbi:MAG: TIGR04255 family protein [Anaerolineales bacterium]|nr:TIGR04255 family protein [Anaerolineales bacterium]